jgi:protein-S-isoprenylcysteine O-methyltransferase Ste14
MSRKTSVCKSGSHAHEVYHGGRTLLSPGTLGWLSLAVMLVPTTLALLYRIHVEEAALNEAFGEEYAAYSQVTRRLIPGIF